MEIADMHNRGTLPGNKRRNGASTSRRNTSRYVDVVNIYIVIIL